MSLCTYFKRLLTALLLLAAFTWPVAAAVSADNSEVRVLVVGDSLSAEYGLSRGEGWVQLLDHELKSANVRGRRPVSFVNASISGETTAGGRTRLPALLRQYQPNVVIIELGANDALRGLDIRSTRTNLDAMVKASQAMRARVLLIGMQVPPNYGKRYTEDLTDAFGSVAKDNGVKLMPFLLKDVADRSDAKQWFQADGIHPLAKAHPIIAKNVKGYLEPLLFGR